MADYCTVNRGGGIELIPCRGNSSVDWTFACGVSSCDTDIAIFTMKRSEANALVLRPCQLASVVTSAGIALATHTTSQNSTNVAIALSDSSKHDWHFTNGDMIGLTLGVGLYQSLVICILSWLLVLQRRRSRAYIMPKRWSVDTDSGEKDALDPRDYSIGWITVEPESELVAARLMLDEAHAKIQASGDCFTYYPGRIGRHNVVITCLGEAGQHQAAECAINMVRTFANIKLGLLSGIGGGVPSTDHDIRLGDVVVGMPDGLHGGVAVYNSGKITAEGCELRSRLNCSPKMVRNTVGGLRADMEMGKDGLAANLARVQILLYKTGDDLIDQLYDGDELQIRTSRPTSGPRKTEKAVASW